jgi:hypothetical protein
VRIAIADSGIDPRHPEFAPHARIETAFDATGRGQHADSAGHGTMVAGIIAARIGDGAHLDSLGIAGVCGGDGKQLPECSVLPIHITIGRSNLASSFSIARAIVHATDAGARVLNLSVAGAGRSRLERLALYYATVRGCIVVAASGNRGFMQEQRPLYPAAYSADGLCIQVGATTPHDARASFSSYGPGLDVVAPGENIWSTWPTYPVGAATWPGYAVGSGTSFAAPFVTGTVGLLVAARPELRDRDAQELLRFTAHDVGPPGADVQHGAGRIDAGRALQAIGPGIGIWHDELAASRLKEIRTDTLWIGEDGPGDFAADASGRVATLYEATATFTLPDSFADTARVWPRVGGTFTVRAGHRLPYFAPWAEVERIGARTVRLRGYVYRSDDRWIPLPPDQLRFGFTVVGPLRSTPVSPGPVALRAHPNPFRSSVIIEAPRGGQVAIVDVTGRQVAHHDMAGSRSFHWNGRDSAGNEVKPGIYFVRLHAAGRTVTTRIAKID